MKKSINCLCLLLLLLTTACNHTEPQESLVLIRIQDRNGLTDTIGAEEKLASYEQVDFLTPQPYQKVVRVYRKEGKSRSVLTSYYPNGMPRQLLEAKEMRANGRFCEWFANGQKKIETTVIGGAADLTAAAQESWLFEGISSVWNEEGQLLASISYEKGVLSGVSSYYYPSGALEKQVTHVQGRLEGDLMEFWEGGETKLKVSYRLGLKEGPSIGFWQNGRVSVEEVYERGLLKEGRYWSPSGELIAEVEKGSGFAALFSGERLAQLREIKRGVQEGLVKVFDERGDLSTLYHVKNGRKHGEEISYYSRKELDADFEGRLPQKLSISWDNDSIHGSVKTWYSNGNLQSQRDYCRNVRSGISCSWFRDGHLMLMEEYEEGRLVKGQYYNNKKSDPVSTVSNGNGIATLYDEEGAFLQKVSYIKGKTVEPES